LGSLVYHEKQLRKLRQRLFLFANVPTSLYQGVLKIGVPIILRRRETTDPCNDSIPAFWVAEVSIENSVLCLCVIGIRINTCQSEKVAEINLNTLLADILPKDALASDASSNSFMSAEMLITFRFSDS
jgi:hypothetical protein